MACRLNSAKPVSNPVLNLWSLFKTFNFHLAIYIRKCRLLWNAGHFASKPMRYVISTCIIVRNSAYIYIYIYIYIYSFECIRSFLISKVDGGSLKCMNIFTEDALKCRLQDLIDDKSSFFQINTELYFMYYCTCRWQRVNSPRLSDAIWWHRAGSTLAQVMACCLTAPSHYLNQCWLITLVQWCSSEGNFALDISQPSVTKINLKIIFIRLYWNLPGANELSLPGVAAVHIVGIIVQIFTLFIFIVCDNFCSNVI